MVKNVLTYDDTSVKIRGKEVTATSPAVELTGFRWPSLCRRDAALWVQNVVGTILKWQEQKLNLDFDAEHRRSFFIFADSLQTFVDEIQKQITPETGYERGQLSISASLPTWGQRFEQLRQLPQNWDSYGASRISDKAIEKGESILTVMTAAAFDQQFFVAPSPKGGVQIEWELPGKELILEIPPSGEPITYLLVETTSTGEEREAEETIAGTEGLKHLLERISA